MVFSPIFFVELLPHFPLQVFVNLLVHVVTRRLLPKTMSDVRRTM